MSRFGDFTILEELGRSAVADRFRASHATLGGPFFLKTYPRLDRRYHGDLQQRCDRLLGKTHANLTSHLGHGVVGGVPFVVSPWLDGVDLVAMAASLKERRVTLTLDTCALVLRDLSTAVEALHAFAPSSTGTLLGHGDVSLSHVRIGPDGQVWLTGLTTPRGLEPGRVPEGRFDLAGAAALIYDLVPLLRGGAARPPLPTVLDRVIRRGLGIGPPAEHVGAAEFRDRLDDATEGLKLRPDRAVLADLARRTLKAIEKKLAEQGPATAARATSSATGNATTSDGIAQLEPLAAARPVDVPLLEPLAPLAASATPNPSTSAAAAVPSLEPLSNLEALRPLEPIRPATPVRPVVTPARPAPLPAELAPTTPTARPTPFAMQPHAAPTTPPATPAPQPAGIPQPAVVPQPGVTPTTGVVPWAHARAMTPAPMRAPTTAPATEPKPEPAPSPFDVARSASIARGPKSLLADDDLSAPRTVSPVAALKAPAPILPTPSTAMPVMSPSVQALVARGLVTPPQALEASREVAQRGGRALEVIVHRGLLTDEQVADALAAASGRVRIADADLLHVDGTLLKRLPQTYVLARRILPVSLRDGVLMLAVADPFEHAVVDEVRALLGAASVDLRVAARAVLTQATMSAHAGDRSGLPISGTGPRVLLCVVDDNVANTLGARLAQEGMQVEHVVDGGNAKQILEVRPPDAIVCATDLPRENAQALLLVARASSTLHDLPFFVLGPRGDDDLMARLLDLGADDYFAAPLRPDVLVAKLRRAVGKGRATPSQPPAPAAMKPAAVQTTQPGPPSLAASDEFDFGDLPDLPPEFEDKAAQDTPAMPTGVMGTLRQMSLPEIVQSLEMGRKTASVDIFPADGEKGQIAFEQGAIKYGECGTLRGDEAFFSLMRHKEGFFRIHYGDAPKAINIDAPTTFLLLEAMRLMDEEGGSSA